jgi:hypothetical protein
MKRGDDEPPKYLQPLEQERLVVAGGSRDSVERIALGVGQKVAAHPVFVLDVADTGSTADRRRISRLMAGVTRRFWRR